MMRVYFAVAGSGQSISDSFWGWIGVVTAAAVVGVLVSAGKWLDKKWPTTPKQMKAIRFWTAIAGLAALIACIVLIVISAK